MKKISIVIPAFNEEGNLSKVRKEIDDVFASLQNYSYEIIFVNDGSRDNTQSTIENLSAQFTNVKYIEFSRNFGHQYAVKAGMDNASGNAVIAMDADMQHPPKLIPELIKKWEQGYDVVYTIRKYSDKISFFKRVTSSLFYSFLLKISDFELVQKGGADFRLLDRNVNDVIKEFNENDLFLRGLTGWIGFKQIGVEYTAKDRFSGKSSYNLKKMFSLAFSGITSFSTKPLYLAAYVGFAFTILSLLVYGIYIIYSFVIGTHISGWASLIMTVVFFGGMQLIMMGIIGMYLGKIFKQVKDRPNYIIRSKNF
jgi:dolichol-phosphate mannosyltransferase